MIIPSQNTQLALSVITQYLENSLMLKLAQGTFGMVWMSNLREGVPPYHPVFEHGTWCKFWQTCA
jgi:hypothetical protein